MEEEEEEVARRVRREGVAGEEEVAALHHLKLLQIVEQLAHWAVAERAWEGVVAFSIPSSRPQLQ